MLWVPLNMGIIREISGNFSVFRVVTLCFLTFTWRFWQSIEVIKKTLLIIMSSSVWLEAVRACFLIENWLLPRQICCTIKLRKFIVSLTWVLVILLLIFTSLALLSLVGCLTEGRWPVGRTEWCSQKHPVIISSSSPFASDFVRRFRFSQEL